MQMRAVVIGPGGHAESLSLSERPMPVPGPGEVRIQVKASGVNRPDIFQRKGHYPAPKGVVQDIPGLEVAGVVEAVGTGVSRWQLGDAVCALLPGGGYAAFAVVPASLCLPIPGSLNFAQAACLPETVFTVWHNLFQRGGLHSQDRVLIHGGSGGIGTTAIQLAALFSAQVYTTAGSDARCERCKDLGATMAINYKTADFSKLLQDQKISLILDSIGGDYFEKNLEVLQEDGRLIHINAMQGSQVDLDLWVLMQKRITVSGSTLRARSIAFKSALAKEVEDKVWPCIEKGLFRPILDSSFSCEEAALAHRYVEEGQVFGQVVLEW